MQIWPELVESLLVFVLLYYIESLLELLHPTQVLLHLVTALRPWEFPI